LNDLEDKTRVFHSRVMKNSRKLFAKADKSDGFKSVSQEKRLLEILKGSYEISKAILVQFGISDAISQVANDIHGSNKDHMAPNCEELFSQPDNSLKREVDFLKNKTEEVTGSLENLRRDMIAVSVEHDRLIDIHDNWWKDLHRQAKRAVNICDDMAARRDASRKALVRVLVLLHTFGNQMSRVLHSNVSPSS